MFEDNFDRMLVFKMLTILPFIKYTIEIWYLGRLIIYAPFTVSPIYQKKHKWSCGYKQAINLPTNS